MKKFLLFLVLIITIFSFSKVKAATVSDSAALTTILNDGGEAKLDSNITLTADTYVNNDAILDLNGHTLTMSSKSLISYANLTITDTSNSQTGKITGSGTYYIVKVGSASNTGKITMEKGHIDCSSKSYCVNVLAKGTFILNDGKIEAIHLPVAVGGTLEINGGVIEASDGSGVYGNTNGQITMNDGLITVLTDWVGVVLSKPNSKFTMNGGLIETLYEGGEQGAGVNAFKDTEVVINDGTIISAANCIITSGNVSGNNAGTNAKVTVNGGTLTSTKETALYLPQQNGINLISGGTITGEKAGVELRAGTLTITGGTITANQNSYSIDHNDNGTTTSGVAISVAQHNTKLPTTLNIEGGTFNAYIPVVETNPSNNTSEDLEKVEINISNGTFISKGNKSLLFEDSEVSRNITGGAYTHHVTEYIDTDVYGELYNNNLYNVLPYVDLNIEEISSKDETKTEKVLSGEEITITPKEIEDYEVESITVTDKDNNKIEVKNNKFKITNGPVTIKIKYHFVYKIISGADQTYKNESLTIKSNGDLNNLLRIEVNDKELNELNYELKSGSTILTLNKDYLNSLENGNYKLCFVYNDGSIDTTFIINNKVSDTNTETKENNKKDIIIINPKTTDNMIYGLILFILSVTGIILLYFAHKKSKQKNSL